MAKRRKTSSTSSSTLPDPTAEWTRTEADRQAVKEGCWFDPKAANAVVQFFEKFLRHSKGQWAGQPFVPLEWQKRDLLMPLFGWKRADGTRRFRRAGCWVPKKQGKSTISSGIALKMLLEEPGAEVYVAASDREQAGIVFNESAAMVAASPALAGRLEIVRSTKRIIDLKRNAVYKALSADVPNKEGLNWNCLIFDELHAQKTRDMWDTLTYGGAARQQPLLISISTAGYDRDSIGYEQYLYAKRVWTGEIIDTSFFAYLAEAEVEDDWKSPDVWKKANPSLGVTVPLVDFEEKCREAQLSPAKENAFRRYRLNQWTEADVRWITSARWDACNQPIDLEALKGADCFAGLDLSSTLDTSSLSLLFPHEDETYSILPFVWVPETACRERERKNKQRFDEWCRRGQMFKTDGDVINYAIIRQKLIELRDIYNIKEVAFDPWNSTALATELDGEGFKCVQFRQGFSSMSEPAKEFEKLVLSKKIRHGDHPVLKWMVGNCSVEIDAAGNIKPSKKKSTEKIDLVVSAIMALGRAMFANNLDNWYHKGVLLE